MNLKSPRHGFLERLLIDDGVELDETHIEVVSVVPSQIITS